MSNTTACSGCKFSKSCGYPDRLIPCIGYERSESETVQKPLEDVFLAASTDYVEQKVSELKKKDMNEEFKRLSY